MTTKELFDECRDKGIKIRLKNGGISVKAPKDAMDKHTKELIADNKQLLIGYLKSLQHGGTCTKCGNKMVKDEIGDLIFLDCPAEHYSATFHRYWMPLEMQ